MQMWDPNHITETAKQKGRRYSRALEPASQRLTETVNSLPVLDQPATFVHSFTHSFIVSDCILNKNIIHSFILSFIHIR